MKDLASELQKEVDAGGPILLDKVLRWMKSDDPEVQDFVYSLISEFTMRSRIEPQLEHGDIASFLKAYLERSLMENPQREWSLSDMEAGWQIAYWFVSWWDKGDVARQTLPEWKDWLAGLYLNANADLRRLLRRAVLERLFVRKEIRQFFADWKLHPVLSEAYEFSWGNKNK